MKQPNEIGLNLENLIPEETQDAGLQPIYIYSSDADDRTKKICKEACKDATTPEEVEEIIHDLFRNVIQIYTGGYDKHGAPIARPIASSPIFKNREGFFVSETINALNINTPIFEDPSKFTIARNPNPGDFLAATLLLLPDLDPTYLKENIEVIKNAVNVLWDRLNQKTGSVQSMLYLYSTEGMTGKSLFFNILRKWAFSRGVKLTTTKVPCNQFIDTTFNENAIVIFDDPDKEQTVRWNRLNNLIDGTHYVVEKKGKDSYKLKAQAFLIAGSNRIPKDDNNRRIKESLVYMGSQQINQSTLPSAFRCVEGSVNLDYYIPVVDKWLEACPPRDFSYNKYLPNLQHNVHPFVDAIEEDYLWVLRSICTLLLWNDFTYIKNNGPKLSVATMVYNLNKKEDRDSMGLELDYSIKFTNRQILHALNTLARAGLITAPNNTKGSYANIWDLTPLQAEAFDILDINSATYKYEAYFPISSQDKDITQMKKLIASTIITLNDNNYKPTDFSLSHLPILKGEISD